MDPNIKIMTNQIAFKNKIIFLMDPTKKNHEKS